MAKEEKKEGLPHNRVTELDTSRTKEACISRTALPDFSGEPTLPDPSAIFNIGRKGGKREHFYPMYECLEPDFLHRIAKVMTEGARKYSVDNYKNFDEEQTLDLARHVFKHIVDFMNGDDTEDHIANCACNLMMLAYFETQGIKVRVRGPKKSRFAKIVADAT